MRRADFPVNRGGLCRRAGPRPSCSTTRERLTTPLVRDAPDARRCARRAGTRRSTGSPRRSASSPGRARRGRGRLLRRRRADQREGLPARQVRPRRAAHRDDRLQRAVLHVVGRGGGQPRLRHRPRAAVPARGRRRRRRVLLVGSNPADTMPPPCSASTRGRRAAARTSSSTRAARPPRSGAHLHLQPRPAPTSRSPTACCTSRSATGSSTRPTSPTAPPGSTRCGARCAAYWPDRVERITGVPVADLREAARLLGRRATRDDPHRARRRAAQQRHRHRARVINLALALGLPGRPAPATARITGQGNGQGGREHGQKADQLPGYRRIDDPGGPRARRGGLGRRPGRPARPGRLGLRDARPRWAPTAACARCW